MSDAAQQAAPKEGRPLGFGDIVFLVDRHAVTYAPSRPGMLLAFIEAQPGAEGALAQAVSEAVIFSGVEAAAPKEGGRCYPDLPGHRLNTT